MGHLWSSGQRCGPMNLGRLDPSASLRAGLANAPVPTRAGWLDGSEMRHHTS